MSIRRVLVTGVANPVGSLTAQRMAARAGVESVTGVADAACPTVAGVEIVVLSGDYAGIADLVQRRQVDTIVHADRPQPEPSGGRAGTSNHVIETMQLAAAAAHRAATVRRVVMISSTRVYPASPRAPLLHSEPAPLRPRRGSLAASILDAEGFMRDLATANPNLSVCILRLADLTGPGTNDALGALLRHPMAPAIWGFDPPVQLLDVGDAVAAVAYAADHDLAGIYNVAGDGLVRWRRAAQLARRPLIELPAGPAPALNRLMRWFYRLDAVDDVFDVLRYGRAGATDALNRCGFQPTWTTEQCVPVSGADAVRHPCHRASG